MKRLSHPNIIHLNEFLESGNNYYMVLGYCNGGDLEKAVSKMPGNCMSEPDAIAIFAQIISAFKLLQEQKIMHRDFKLANIFLHNGVPIIGDFGFAKSGFEMAQTKLGTPLTMAPELHFGDVSVIYSAKLYE